MATNKSKKTEINDDLVYKATGIFSAFADSTRFKILIILSEEEQSVSDIVEKCGMSQSAVSHQLRLLKDKALVKARRDGKSILYSLDDDHVRALLEIGIEHAEHRTMR